MSKKKKSRSKSAPHTPERLIREAIKAFKDHPQKAFNYRQLAGLLDIQDDASRKLLMQLMEDLSKQQIISEVHKGKYQLLSKTKGPHIQGRIDFTSSGAAYLVPDEEGHEDIYIAPAKVGQALDKDIVKVYVYGNRKHGKLEGEVVEIVRRARTEFVGVVQLSKNFGFLIPDNQKSGVDIYIPLESTLGVKNGEKAICRITEWPKNAKNPIGEIIKVLGAPGENDVEMHAILADFGLPYEFPKHVEKEAEDLPTIITDEEIERRRDMRNITTFTIDPVDAKDFDDALSVQRLENGNWEIGVHIADVSHYIKEGSVLDQEALKRATSIYLVDRVVPMLPEMLSNFVCSLRPHEDKLTFSAVFEIDEEANVINEWFGRTVINSDHRFSYEEAQEVLDTGKGPFKDELFLLNKLAKQLRKLRKKKGSIDFHSIEVKFRLDEKGDPLGVYLKEIKDSNQLIEDFMLLANKRVAEFVGKVKKKPFVYRIHNTPDEERLQVFTDFVSKLGYKMSNKSSKDLSNSFNKLLTEVSGKKEENMIEQLAIRTMAKAAYSTENIGHYGLAFEYYSHFTSPIRRYPDVLVHRLLAAYLENKPAPSKELLEDMAKHSSAMERLAAEAERASIKYKQVQFLQDRVGEQFEGLISGVSDFGIFVEIIENKCEGMVRLRDINDDFYVYDEESYSITGKRKGKKYQIGDKVVVEIKKADLLRKQIDFKLIGGSEDFPGEDF